MPMAKRNLRPGVWFVACDGRKALILVNDGNAQHPNFRTIEAREEKAAATHDMGTDAPGRVHASAGTAQSSVEQTDWHDRAEQKFLETLAQRLDSAVTNGEAKELIIAAAPRALGMLRKAYTKQLRNAIVGELDKDLVKMTLPDIQREIMQFSTIG